MQLMLAEAEADAPETTAVVAATAALVADSTDETAAVAPLAEAAADAEEAAVPAATATDVATAAWSPAAADTAATAEALPPAAAVEAAACAGGGRCYGRRTAFMMLDMSSARNSNGDGPLPVAGLWLAEAAACQLSPKLPSHH